MIDQEEYTVSEYSIRLWPHLEQGLFDGAVLITVHVLKPTSTILLHSHLLNIIRCELTQLGSDHTIHISDTTCENQILRLNLPRQLSPGNYSLSIQYEGSLRDRIVGFYTSSYKNHEGKSRTIVSSKFEPTYARQAFPCFDEPAMKAKYTVEITTPENYIALSNMDQVGNEARDGKNVVKFRESVPMSTYLLCFIVCDFDNVGVKIETSIGDPFDLRVFAVKGQLDKVEFAKDIGKSVTEYYIRYFNLSYPLPKLDMIAIPDFVSGAMEHWGLVTFRETNLLYNKNTTSTANKQNIARVIAHEISHMWFGNLVTMKWWNDLWLNEGFASYMQYKALDVIHPEWKMLEQFPNANTHSILDLDATLSSHPIVQTVKTPDEITAIFDSVTYNKGAAVIRMLENFVGEETFKQGISAYLKKYQYKNTITQDLIDELATIFEKDPQNKDFNLTYIMDTWTRQMGLPMITVTKKNDTTYTLKQQRFLANPNNVNATPSEFNDRWFIPVTYRTKTDETNLVWFPDSQDSVDIKVDGLLKINNDQVGYYRVNYEKNLWLSLMEELSDFGKSHLTASDRAHLINDIFNLADASQVEYELALELSSYLVNETDYAPWSVASDEFVFLKRIMSNSNAFIEYKQYVKDLLKNIYESLNPSSPTKDDNDEHIKDLLSSTILSTACSVGYEDALKKTKDIFLNWLTNSNNAVDPNIKGTVYYYGIESTGEKEWLELWKKFTNEEDAQEISKLLQALAGSKDPAILKRYLNLAWNETYIRAQDHLTVINHISANPVGTPLAWDHVRENWEKLVDKFTLNSRTLGSMIPYITKSFATNTKLKEVEDFFELYPEAGAGASGRERAKENIRNNIQWLETHEPTVRQWLEKRNPV